MMEEKWLLMHLKIKYFQQLLNIHNIFQKKILEKIHHQKVKVQVLIDPLRKMLKFLKDTSDTAYNNTKVTLMKSRLRSLKNDIKNMSENLDL